MDMMSVALLRPLVNQVYLIWCHLRRIPGAWLWGLWMGSIVVHLLLLFSGIVAFGTEVAAVRESELVVLRATPILRPVLGGMGWLILMLVLQPGECTPFPWSQYRVRWRVRRRRLADMSFGELFALLPPGVRTIAQVVDLVTRSQMAKSLCAIPVIYPILVELEVEKIIDQHCPTEAEANIGVVIVILCLNRLVTPLPLSRISDWAAKTVIEEYTGIPASKLNSLP